MRAEPPTEPRARNEVQVVVADVRHSGSLADCPAGDRAAVGAAVVSLRPFAARSLLSVSWVVGHRVPTCLLLAVAATPFPQRRGAS